MTKASISICAVLTLLICLGWGLGCSSKNFGEPLVANVSAGGPTKVTFSKSYGTVWKAAMKSLKTKKYAIAESKKDGGLIVTDWILGKSDRLFSGYGETRIPYNIRFKITVKFRTSRKGIEVSVSGKEQYYSDSITAGTDFRGSLYQWIPTKSSGAKEAALIADMRTQLPTKGKR